MKRALVNKFSISIFMTLFAVEIGNKAYLAYVMQNWFICFTHTISALIVLAYAVSAYNDLP